MKKRISAQYAVVVSYSWDPNWVVILCDSEEDAVDYIRKDYESELQQATNLHESSIDEDGWYAKIVTAAPVSGSDEVDYATMEYVLTTDLRVHF